MTGQQLLVGTELELDRRERETDTREREDDPTPRELVRALLEAVGWSWLPARMRPPSTIRVLDAFAGYGCWSSEFRRWFGGQLLRFGVEFPLEITGLEICEARREHLAKWCDHVIIGDWFEGHCRPSQFDVIIGNPPFSALVADDPASSMPAMLLLHAPAVLLLHQSSNFQRGMPGVAAWRHCPPARVWLVPGSVQFRRGRNPKNGKPWGSDSRCYQASLWLRGHSGPTLTEMLPSPADGGASWRWVEPPGSEMPSAELPAAPGWTP